MKITFQPNERLGRREEEHDIYKITHLRKKQRHNLGQENGEY